MLQPSRWFLPFLLTGGLAAQLTPPATHLPSFVEVSYSLGSGTFQRIELGRFQGPLYLRDAIVLRGSDLGHLFGVGAYNFLADFAYGAAVSDMVTVRGANPNDSRYDALIVAPAAVGALSWIYWIDENTRQTDTYALPAWQDVTQLGVAAIAGGYDVTGVATGGQTVLRATVDGSGITHVSAYYTGRTIEDSVLGDYDGDGELESFCLLDNGAVTISSRNGVFLAVIPGNHPGGALARIGNRVCRLGRNVPNSSWELSFVAGGGPFTGPAEVTLNGSDFDLTGVRRSDVDQQGELDLLVSQTTTREALQVRIDTTSPPTLAVDLQTVALSAAPGASGAGNHCVAATADLDGDGYDDIVAPRDVPSPTIAIVRGTGFGRDYAPDAYSDLLADTGSIFDLSTTTGLETGLYLRLADNDLFANSTNVLVNLWTQPSSSAGLDIAGRFQCNYAIDLGTGSPSEHSLHIPEWDGYDEDGFCFLEIVFGDFNGDFEDGVVFYAAGFGMDSDKNEFQYYDTGSNHLAVYAIEGEPIRGATPISVTSQEDPPSHGRVLIGGHVRTWGTPTPLSKVTRAEPIGQSSTKPVQ